MAWRIAGIDGWGGGQAILFFPPRRCEAPGLQEGIGHHGHQRVPMQPGPGAAFEMAQPKFLLELLVCLLADPARLDRCGQLLERCLGRQV